MLRVTLLPQDWTPCSVISVTATATPTPGLTPTPSLSPTPSRTGAASSTPTSNSSSSSGVPLMKVQFDLIAAAPGLSSALVLASASTGQQVRAALAATLTAVASVGTVQPAHVLIESITDLASGVSTPVSVSHPMNAWDTGSSTRLLARLAGPASEQEEPSNTGRRLQGIGVNFTIAILSAPELAPTLPTATIVGNLVNALSQPSQSGFLTTFQQQLAQLDSGQNPVSGATLTVSAPTVLSLPPSPSAQPATGMGAQGGEASMTLIAAAAGTAVGAAVLAAVGCALYKRKGAGRKRANAGKAAQGGDNDKKAPGASTAGARQDNGMQSKSKSNLLSHLGTAAAPPADRSSNEAAAPPASPQAHQLLLSSTSMQHAPTEVKEGIEASGIKDVAAAAADAFAGALETVAPSLPLIGAALSGLAALFRLVKGMQSNTEETQALLERISRLDSLLKAVGREEAFLQRHARILEGLLATVQGAEASVRVMSERRVVVKVVQARRDEAQLNAIDKALSMHLAELTAAMQAETLSSVRALQETMISGQATGVVTTVQPAPPPPPFSMQFTLKDIAFDPPLETQLKTAPRGSYGVIVFGYWRAHSIRVAVKLLPARGPTGEEVIRIMSWLAEAEVMRRLRDSQGPGKIPAHVVLLYGIGAEEASKGAGGGGGVSQYLVVMERLHINLREALDAYKRKRKTPSLGIALAWLLQTARGISECHACNVVHSDVKATNVLLTEGDRRAKLGDLGTSRVMRAAASTLSMTGTSTSTGARGSPLWLAPELVEDPSRSPQSPCDVYSWAVTAWEILTLRLPYHDGEGQPVVDVNKLKSKMELVAGTLRPDLSAIRPDAPPALTSLITACWASQPRARPRIQDVVQQVERIMEEAKSSGTSSSSSSSSSNADTQALPGTLV